MFTLTWNAEKIQNGRTDTGNTDRQVEGSTHQLNEMSCSNISNINVRYLFQSTQELKQTLWCMPSLHSGGKLPLGLNNQAPCHEGI
jgi:hypothetical protein